MSAVSAGRPLKAAHSPLIPCTRSCPRVRRVRPAHRPKQIECLIYALAYNVECCVIDIYVVLVLRVGHTAVQLSSAETTSGCDVTSTVSCMRDLDLDRSSGRRFQQTAETRGRLLYVLRALHISRRPISVLCRPELYYIAVLDCCVVCCVPHTVIVNHDRGDISIRKE